MRCLFSMFAEDVDLIPRGSFTDLCCASCAAIRKMQSTRWQGCGKPWTKASTPMPC